MHLQDYKKSMPRKVDRFKNWMMVLFAKTSKFNDDGFIELYQFYS